MGILSACVASLVEVYLSHRSQRDVSGEREQRLRELHEQEEKLKKVEGELTTADNDRNQFHNAATRSNEMLKDKQ